MIIILNNLTFMKVALHGKFFSRETLPLITDIAHTLNRYEASLCVSPSLHALLDASAIQRALGQSLPQVEDYTNLDLVISLGGDGTLLEAVNCVGASETPVLGINAGRMGFLATVAQANALFVLEKFLQGKHIVDKRTLLQLEAQDILTSDRDFVLNEVAFLKKDISSMITIHASINGELRTTYWADGLIITTPTGSTGYSLSYGGPIVLPSAHNIVVTPVSPHNLSVRPLVIPDNAVLSFKVESRNQKFMITLDGRYRTASTEVEQTVRKAPFQAHLVKTGQDNMFDVLRQKLHWGLDVRN